MAYDFYKKAEWGLSAGMTVMIITGPYKGEWGYISGFQDNRGMGIYFNRTDWPKGLEVGDQSFAYVGHTGHDLEVQPFYNWLQWAILRARYISVSSR